MAASSSRGCLARLFMAVGLSVLLSQSSVQGGSNLRASAIVSPLRTAAQGALKHSGGWGWTTPAIIIGANLALGVIDSDGGGVDKAMGLMTNPKFWGGVVGSLVIASLATRVATGLPGAAFLRTAVAMSGGFLGWEIGSLNIANADWLSIGSQIAAATAAYLAVQRIMGVTGFMGGGWQATAAAIGAAVLTGIILDKVRKKSLDPPLNGDPAPPTIHVRAPQSPRSTSGQSSDLGSLRREWKETVRVFGIAPSMEHHADLQRAEQAYFRGLQAAHENR